MMSSDSCVFCGAVLCAVGHSWHLGRRPTRVFEDPLRRPPQGSSLHRILGRLDPTLGASRLDRASPSHCCRPIRVCRLRMDVSEPTLRERNRPVVRAYRSAYSDRSSDRSKLSDDHCANHAPRAPMTMFAIHKAQVGRRNLGKLSM